MLVRKRQEIGQGRESQESRDKGAERGGVELNSQHLPHGRGLYERKGYRRQGGGDGDPVCKNKTTCMPTSKCTNPPRTRVRSRVRRIVGRAVRSSKTGSRHPILVAAEAKIICSPPR